MDYVIKYLWGNRGEGYRSVVFYASSVAFLKNGDYIWTCFQSGPPLFLTILNVNSQFRLIFFGAECLILILTLHTSQEINKTAIWKYLLHYLPHSKWMKQNIYESHKYRTVLQNHSQFELWSLDQHIQNPGFFFTNPSAVTNPPQHFKWKSLKIAETQVLMILIKERALIIDNVSNFHLH